MKRTTIFLERSMELDLKALAYRKNEPVSHLVREAIARYVASEVEALPRLPSFVGSFESGYTDTSQRVDELVLQAIEQKHGLRPIGSPPKRKRRTVKSR